MPIHHDAAQHKFTDGEAELVYEKPTERVIDFVHTYVPENRRNEGVGDALARAGLTYAREHQLQVRASCPFVSAFLQRHPELADQTVY